MSARLTKAGETRGSFIEGKPKVVLTEKRELQNERVHLIHRKTKAATAPQSHPPTQDTVVGEIQQQMAQASSLVSQWLAQMKESSPVSEKDAQQDEKTIQAVSAEFEEYSQRPARLGLGAKYLTHKRATETTNPIQQKLKRQIADPKRQTRPFGMHIEDEDASDHESESKEISKSTTPLSKTSSNPLASFLGKKRFPTKKAKKPRQQ